LCCGKQGGMYDVVRHGRQALFAGRVCGEVEARARHGK
jgi:hypothetical protein